MSIWWSLHLRRETASVPLARRLLLGAMETAGVQADTAYELALALSEACANAVEHGGSPGQPDQYRVTAFLDGDMCRIEVSDHGPGFPADDQADADESHRADESQHADESASACGPAEARAAAATLQRAPRLVPLELAELAPPVEPECGRGMYLIAALCDHARFDNIPGDGAVVSFDKALKWREDSVLRS